MAAVSRPNQVRHRKLSRMRKAGNALKAFLVAQATRLASTASGHTFTAANSTEIFSATAHGFVTGKGPVVVTNSGGALPAGLTALMSYWPIKITNDTFYLATSRENAVNGVHLLISGDGTGTQTIKYESTSRSMLSRLKQRVKSRRLKSVSDIDNL